MHLLFSFASGFPEEPGGNVKKETMYEFELNGTPVKIWTKSVDPHAMKEIVNLSTLPFVFHHLAFMPDVHSGSRNLGLQVGNYYNEKAKTPNRHWYSAAPGPYLAIHVAGTQRGGSPVAGCGLRFLRWTAPAEDRILTKLSESC